MGCRASRAQVNVQLHKAIVWQRDYALATELLHRTRRRGASPALAIDAPCGELGSSALFDCSQRLDRRGVLCCLKHGADINYVTETANLTPLSTATHHEHGNVAMAKFLVRHRANVNHVTDTTVRHSY
jgi:ankyrin repeat protein